MIDTVGFFGGGSAIAVVAVFALAGLVKGVVGLGLPTVAMALLALMMTPAEAAALVVVPSLVTNLWQLRPLDALPAAATRLAPMLVATAVGTLVGAAVLGAPAGASSRFWLGVALLAYAGWGLAGAEWRIDAGRERVYGPVAGVLTGIATALTGVFAVPAVPYLQSLGLSREALVQAMGLSFTVSTIALAAGLAFNGALSVGVAGASVTLLVPAIVGMAVGQRLAARMSPVLFRRVLLLALLLLGAHLLVRAI